VITEVGGTVGDIEILPFLEAIRQIRLDVGRTTCATSTSPWCPSSVPRASRRPSRPSTRSPSCAAGASPRRDRLSLRGRAGWRPEAQDLIDVRRRPVGGHQRSRRVQPLRAAAGHARGGPRHRRRRGARPRGRPTRPDRVGGGGGPRGGGRHTGAHRHHRASTSAWSTPTCRSSRRSTTPRRSTTSSQDEIDWIQAEDVEGLLAEGRLHDLDGIIIPGGFGERGVEGKIAAAGYAREHGTSRAWVCAWACR
jgi:CTP synthase